MYNGETYSTKMEKPGWNLPGYVYTKDWSEPVLAKKKKDYPNG